MENKNKIIILSFLFFVLSSSVFGQTKAPKKYVQKVEWDECEGAEAYKVEIYSKDTKESLFFETEDTFVEFSMPAGPYKFRVTAYDILGREASVSSWKNFKIVKIKREEDYLNFYISMGCGGEFYLYDGKMRYYNGNECAFSPHCEITSLFADLQNVRMGINCFFAGSILSMEDSNQSVVIPNAVVTLDYMVQIPLVDDKLFLRADAGAGVYLMQFAKFKSTVAGEGKPLEYSCSFALKAGVDLVWQPFRPFDIKTGCNYVHAFIKDMPTGIIIPNIELGWRF
ncbi:MAG: hypothetical protein IKX23_05455 [Treponema sp.]|nr:hypothetical protein [Treponema sp.]